MFLFFFLFKSSRLLTYVFRQVLANLIEMPQRYDWKACMLSEEEDRADAEEFKKAFSPFDPFA